MTRATLSLVVLAVLGSAAGADCIVLKKGGKLTLWGAPQTIGNPPNQIEVTPENIDLYSEQTTGVIDSEGYDGVVCRKSKESKQTETFPWSEVDRVLYSSEPDALGTGLTNMEQGNWLQAVNDFKDVAEDASVRDTFKYRALYLMGVCYYNAGRPKDCIAHLKAWKPVNSTFTPEAYRMLAELLTDQRQFAPARAQYEEISKLPNIPDAWKVKARLGAVKVDAAERKFDDAERTAQGIARETQGRPELADANVLALVLQADVIWKSGKADRLPEAAAILDRAVPIEGATDETRAYLFLTQGNILYAQKKTEEARFPYMRAALMYPDSGYDGLAYLNAGTCFLDMSGQFDGKDQAKSDDYLVKGMQLLATAAGRYRNPEAAKRYRENKPRYEAVTAKTGSEAPAETPSKPGEGK